MNEALTWSVIVPRSTLLFSSLDDDDDDDEDDDERRRLWESVWTPASTSSTLFEVFLSFLPAASDSESLESELSESESDDDDDDDDDDECWRGSVCVSTLTVVLVEPAPRSIVLTRRGRTLDSRGRS